MGRPSGLDPTRNPRDTSKGCVSLKSDLRFLQIQEPETPYGVWKNKKVENLSSPPYERSLTFVDHSKKTTEILKGCSYCEKLITYSIKVI